MNENLPDDTSLQVLRYTQGDELWYDQLGEVLDEVQVSWGGSFLVHHRSFGDMILHLVTMCLNGEEQLLELLNNNKQC